MRGGASPVVTEGGARELAEARPDASILVVPEAGHMIPWDDLDGFLRATREFLGAVREGARA
jgi:N-formylmaleamate deformylase